MYPSDQTSKITVFRKQSLIGALIAYTVKINKVPHPQKIMVNDKVEIPLQPGQYELQISAGLQGSKPLAFALRPGEQIDFTCEGAMLGVMHPIMLYRNDVPQVSNASQKINRFFNPQSQSAQSQSGQAAQFQPQPAGPAAAGMWQMPGAGAPQQPVPSGPVPEPQILGFVETGQVEEPLGQEVRVIDNRQSGTGVTRSVKASREWSRSLTLGTEQTRSAELEAGAKFTKWLSIKGKIEAELQRNYSMETSSKHVFEESLTISAPPRTTIRLVLHWKRIWQEGVVRLSHYDGTISEVPYKFVVNITFDQSQQDTDSDPARLV